jgi:predicted RND superfamily exporter protein
MQHHRADDVTPVKITREIPLWGLVSAIGLFAAQAVALYYGQIALTKTQTEQTESIKQLTAEVKSLSNSIQANNVKDVEHDLKLNDLERRVSKNEQVISVMLGTGKGR